MMDRRRLRCLVVWGVWTAGLALAAGIRGAPTEGSLAFPHRPNRLILVPDAAADSLELDRWAEARGVRTVKRHLQLGDVRVLETPAGARLDQLLAELRNAKLVAWVEPDYLLHAYAQPNDPAFQEGRLWSLRNDGREGGVVGADIGALEAWDTVTGAEAITVAVIDSGIRTTHEDLVGNLWVNPGEIAGNGIDDDQNGIVDDVHGFNAITGSGDLSDDVGHGTHVAGILGAVGDNGRGTVGVAWRVRLMALKFLAADGEGATSDAIECIDYARLHGARIINASWGGPAYSRALQRAVERARAAGILMITAAGNEGTDLEVTPNYPASFGFDNIVTVTATTRGDRLASYANFGGATVDLGAPGDSIYSTWRTGDAAYSLSSGTSMAAPHVSGSFALLMAAHPTLDYPELVGAVLGSVDRVSELEGRTKSGGRLNLRRALEALRPAAAAAASLNLVPAGSGAALIRLSGTPGATYRLETSMNLVEWNVWVAVEADETGKSESALSTALANTTFVRAVAGP